MNLLRPAISLFVLLTLVTGVGYPLLTTGVSQWGFAGQAMGSLEHNDTQVVGSGLIGQDFTRADYFQGRPSATTPIPYNALASSGSNLAASNPALDQAIQQRIAQLRRANPQASPLVPAELVTASASGLDPAISPAAALWQVSRIALARHLPVGRVRQLITDNTNRPIVWFMGEPVVNLLKLNLALDKLPTR